MVPTINLQFKKRFIQFLTVTIHLYDDYDDNGGIIWWFILPRFSPCEILFWEFLNFKDIPSFIFYKFVYDKEEKKKKKEKKSREK